MFGRNENGECLVDIDIDIDINNNVESSMNENVIIPTCINDIIQSQYKDMRIEYVRLGYRTTSFTLVKNHMCV